MFICRKEVTKKRSKLGVSKISLILIGYKSKQISGMWQFSHIAYMRRKNRNINLNRILIGKQKGFRPFDRPNYRW
jgi:hypothetical protein